MDIIYHLEEKHINQLHLLYQQEWWTNKRTLEQTAACINGSQICIGLINESGELKGFARVLTDYVFKALIFDVIVSDEHRGEGLGQQLVNLIKGHPELNNVQSFELYCLPELASYYQQFGFSEEVGNLTLLRFFKG